MKQLQGVLFDLDGVIVDTVPYYYEATKQLADELRLPFSEEDNIRFQGRPRMDLMNHLVGDRYTHEEKVELGERRNRYYQERIATLTRADMMPGIEDFIEQLLKEGIPIALTSSSSNAEFVLQQIQLLDAFTAVIDPKSVSKGKPHPDIFLKGAEAIMVPEENCVAIEDGEAGLAAILQTNMYAVGIGPYDHLQQADWHILDSTKLTVSALKENFYKKQ
ncbi:beta-phosphoglucomutase [Pontibacillus halophilus JSM 076056 = DSM 19796]|uniref:Beta-phosphoglucomutase n=1 Tax=Pontibacillus halophilus JSM 076056 = DSM 19796 TaxID=1385510 RepID=A0A0A5GMT7_9BACI|nr:beta-phosphoglucomutase [Pontibacillus halophilus]KGX92470.1 beta-phosphoglucomutase [Pontibacillus halophilus JSM 076056 = DSM 19796]